MSIKLVTTYHSNGQKKAEGNWDGFDPVGDHISWYENGNKEYESIEPDEFIMNTTSWFKNGQIMSKGSLSQSNYCEIGIWTYWYENGNKKSEGYFKGDDGRYGEWNFWSSNGQLICSGVHKGWRGDGVWTFWDEAGIKVHEREYKNSELLDIWKNLRADGCSEERIDMYKELIFVKPL
jgi:antitoxin component YwqK of YwqJK toxin-antitoxin module|tara:strand:- start:5 stop:538 length:534 start_codon:yes stop_codon:yes gene_type:complete